MAGRIEAPEVIILSTQRSGTHLLQSILGGHEKVQARGEFILQFRRKRAAGVEAPELDPAELAGFRYRCRPGFVNLGIVMYGQIREYEALCGPLLAPKIIHLVRDPLQVARSRLQMQRDREVLGDQYRAHYRVGDDMALPPVMIDAQAAAALAEEIRLSQQFHLRLLDGKPNVMTVSYEELCGNRQVSQLPAELGERLFGFLGLPPRLTTTQLVKTSERGNGVNQLSILQDAPLAAL